MEGKMITRIGHTAIRARDIEETARFYRDTLGLKEAFRMQSPDGNALGCIYMYIAPSQFIEIFPEGSEEAPHTGKTIGHAHICYEVDNAAAFLEEVRARGAPIDVELKRGYSRCIQFWTHDPDGNSIECMELPPDSLQAQANERIAREGLL
jgi:lactoylglutathione lyase